jgi:sulfatase maturation enzyme AslB (radical SAM superfamily)
MATESVQTTFEEASRCPKCKQPGKDVKTIRLPNNTKIPRGSTVHTIRCENCDFGVWLVQVNADGSVPPPQDHTGKPKQYVGFEGHDQQARDIMRQVRAGVQQEVDRSIQEGGYEIRKRGGSL